MMVRNTLIWPASVMLGVLSLCGIAAESPAGPVTVVAESNAVDNPPLAVPPYLFDTEETGATAGSPSSSGTVSVGGPAVETRASEPSPPAEAPQSSQGKANAVQSGDAKGAKRKHPATKPETKPETKQGEKASAAEPAEKQSLTPAMTALKDRVHRTLAACSRQTLSTQENTASDLLDLCLAYGCQSEVHCAAVGKPINAVTCLCWGYPCGGFQPLFVSRGQVAARVGFGLQKQPGEMLAVFAQSRVPANYPVRVGEDVHTVAELAEYEKRSIRAGTDVALPLIGLMYYVEEPNWKNDLGQPWSIERMIRQELDRPNVGMESNGASQLMALSYVVDRRRKHRQPIDGEFLRAQKFAAEFQEFALRRQNPDGSWGPYVYAAKAANFNPAVPLQATGCALEWLAFSLPEEKLQEERVVRSVEFVCGLLDVQRYPWNCRNSSARDLSSIMHSLHALAIYEGRVFGVAD
jgi:hypothetical protein